MVWSTSIVRVAHIDCTTSGASPPTFSPPISICRVVRRLVPACSIAPIPPPPALVIVALVAVRFGDRLALLIAHRHRDRRMGERRARAQRHRDERSLGDLLVGRALLDRALDVVLDAPRA